MELFVLCGVITKFDMTTAVLSLGKLTVRLLDSWISLGGVTSLFLVVEMFPKIN